MTVCVDTNVLLQARASGHPYGPIMDAFMFGLMKWAVSTRILAEYREIIGSMAGAEAWRTMEAFIDLVEESGDLVRVEPHFQFQVIGIDPDDNAFCDCAIAADADYVITDDRHFAPLAGAGYKPQPISPLEFIERYRGVHV
jgi:putative PIN family toxin of toxin-antitoxin system